MQSEKIDNCLTWIERSSEAQYLKNKLPQVNIRLLKVSKEYKDFIQHACDLIVLRLKTKYSDYKRPHGMSGANCAVPFNIIAYFVNRGKVGEEIKVMLNPQIIQTSKETFVTSTNCGSIRKKDSIKVMRYCEIKVSWYDVYGTKYTGTFTKETGASTIQHEIDHNNGILVTDRHLEFKNLCEHCNEKSIRIK